MIRIDPRDHRRLTRYYAREDASALGLRSGAGWMNSEWVCTQHGKAGGVCDPVVWPRCKTEWDAHRTSALMNRGAIGSRSADDDEKTPAERSCEFIRDMRDQTVRCTAAHHEILYAAVVKVKGFRLPVRYAIAAPPEIHAGTGKEKSEAPDEDFRYAVLRSKAARDAFRETQGYDLADRETHRVSGEHSRLLTRWLGLLDELVSAKKKSDVALLESILGVKRADASARQRDIVQGTITELTEAFEAAGVEVATTEAPVTVGLTELSRKMHMRDSTVREELAKRGISFRRRRSNGQFVIRVDTLAKKWAEAARGVVA